MKYQWVLFDADETLFNFDTFTGLKHMFSELDITFTETDFAEYQTLNVPLWEGYQEGRYTIDDVKTKRFVHWAAKTGLPERELNSRFMASMANTCALLPGARELLDSLKSHANVGIITNGLSELQHVRLERTGVVDDIDVMVVSEEVGVPKPDIEIFNHTFEKMNFFDKDRILMVGDNQHTDILGGIRAGIDTCWYNWRKKPADPTITPTYHVDCLHALRNILTDNISA